MCDILFIWLPGLHAYSCIHSLSTLAGYAESIGLSSAQIDASIGFERYLLSNEALEAHKPSPGATSALYNKWRTVRNVIRRHRNRSYRDGNMISRHICLDYASEYYSDRFRDTFFLKNRFFLRTYSNKSSRDLKGAVGYLMSRRSHPLTAYYNKFLLPRISEEGPRILGLSVSCEHQIIPALLLAAMARRIGFDGHITMGGRWPSLFADIISEHPERFYDHVDTFAVCDGEPVLDGLARYLNGTCELGDIPNLLSRGKNLKKVVYADIHRYPLPVVDPDILAQYVPPPKITVEFSRGCYWGKCAFCSNIVGINRCYRQANMEHVISVLEQLSRVNKDAVFLIGTLSQSPAQLRKFVRRLLRSKARFSWSTWLRLDEGLDASLVREALNAGCRHLAFAPESFCQRTLDLMNKGYRAKKVIASLDDVKRVGLPVNLNIVTGFPGERLEDFEETLSICCEHGFNVGLFPFVLDYGSRMHLQPEKYGLLLNKKLQKIYDISYQLEYRVKKGIPHYSWKDVRDLFIRRYKEQYVDPWSTMEGCEGFCFSA